MKFSPNTENFVYCENCLFFVRQKDLLHPRQQGFCNNKYLYKMGNYPKKYRKVFDAKHQSCGCSLPKNTQININRYFKRDNSDEDKNLRKI